MTHLPRCPWTLYSYLATEMLAPFFASFLVMNGIFFLVKLIPFLNFALDLSIGFADFIRLFSYMLPHMLLYTIPMSAMMGVIICFSRLSNDTEILAMKAGGISIYHILPPLFLVAGAITLVAGYVSITLLPESKVVMKQLTHQLLSEKVDKGIREYTFTEALGDLVVHVGEIDPVEGTWKDVWVSDMRGRKTPAITMASRGRMVSDIEAMRVTIQLENGSLHRPDGRNAQIVNFKSYIITIPLALPTPGEEMKSSEHSLRGLLARADQLGRNTERGRKVLVEFHKRLVLPVGCLIMAILGLPLGLQAGPGKKAVGIPLGLTVFILYYIAYSTAKNRAEEGIASIPLLMWAPNTIFLLIAAYAIHRVAQEQPILPEQIGDFFNNAQQGFSHFVLQRYNKIAGYLLTGFRRGLGRHSTDNVAHRLSQQILADSKRNVFHLPGCRQLDKNCTVLFDSAEEAREAGFHPCDQCIGRKPPISGYHSDGKQV